MTWQQCEICGDAPASGPVNNREDRRTLCLDCRREVERGVIPSMGSITGHNRVPAQAAGPGKRDDDMSFERAVRYQEDGR